MNNRKRLVLALSMLVLLASMFIRLPYYVEMPGVAHELSSIVKVEGGSEKKGQLMLTTVRVGQANVYSFLAAKLNKYEGLVPVESMRMEHETDEDYTLRQLFLMEHSKQNAIQAAYEQAGRPYRFIYKGVYILGVLPGSSAEKVLKTGDRITAADGRAFVSAGQFTEYVRSKDPGDKIRISFIRNKEKRVASIVLADMAGGKGPAKTGMGITLTEERSIISDPPVLFKTEKIGGPSAGLMFSLEIYNQLTDEDITKGHKIAGTGTMTGNGKVGRIGGIRYKVIAAHKAGADIFLAPVDEISQEQRRTNSKVKTNYEEAKETAEDLDINMKIVPVKTLDDAITYLRSLKRKQQV